MNKLLALGVVLGIAVVGCEKKQAAPAEPQAQPQPKTVQEKPVVDQAKDAVEQGTQQVTQAVNEAKAGVQQAATEVQTEATKIAEQAKVEGQKAIDQGTQAVENFDYKAKMDEAMQYVKEHKLELADKTLAQIESRKASIPTEYHTKIDSVRKMIDSAKATQNATQGISLPKF